MRGRVHKPSWWRWSELVLVSQTWGSTAQYELWFILAFCILVRSVLCTCCGGSRVYMHESFERSPPHLFLYLVLIQKQKYGNKLIALPVLRTRELLKFIETKNLISPRYLLKQGWIKIALTWVCCATLIQNLVLPFHLNSAQWLTHGFDFSVEVSPHI